MPVPYRAVSFDCWNTLVCLTKPERSFRRRYERVYHALARHRPNLRRGTSDAALTEAWQAHADAVTRGEAGGAQLVATHVSAAIGVEPTSALRSELVAALSVLENSDVQLLPGALDTLRLVRERGAPTALVCNTGLITAAATRQMLARLEVAPWLSVITLSEELGASKPHPSLFQHTLDALGVPASRCVHIGDSPTADVAGAREAGMDAILFGAPMGSTGKRAGWSTRDHGELQAHLAGVV